MKNNEYMKTIGVSSAVLGIILYRIMKNYYGDKGPKIAIYVCLSIVLMCLISLVLMKKFLAALLSLMLVLPAFVAGIGVQLDNILIIGIGVILLFIMLFVVVKICKK